MTASPSLLNQALVRERTRPGPRRPASVRLVRRLVRPSPSRAVRRGAVPQTVRDGAAASR
jgi:hypothetical protein